MFLILPTEFGLNFKVFKIKILKAIFLQSMFCNTSNSGWSAVNISKLFFFIPQTLYILVKYLKRSSINLVTCRNTYVTTFLIYKKWSFIFCGGFLVLSDLRIFPWLSFGNPFTPAVSSIHVSGNKHNTYRLLFCPSWSCTIICYKIIRSQEKNLNQNRDSNLGPPDF